MINQLAEFYSLKHHIPITVSCYGTGIINWDQESVLLAYPEQCNQMAFLGDTEVPYEPEFGVSLGGMLIQQETIPIARLTDKSLVLLFNPIEEVGTKLAKKIIEDHLRHLSRQFRHQQLDQFVKQIKDYAEGRVKILKANIQSDSWELEDSATKMSECAQRIALNQRLLDLFKSSEDGLAKSLRRRFVDLLRLVPSQYEQISLANNQVTGVTYPVIIEHDDNNFEFGSYKVNVDLGSGQVRITGGRSVNGHIHPHIAEDKTICWGNIGVLVNRLAGQLDLAGLFSLVLQFLKTYNENDPYQRIEKWDPDYDDDDDNESYCEYCDEFGHSTNDCEYCFWCEYCERWVDSDGHDCVLPEDEEEETTSEEVENESELVEAA